MGAAFPLPYKSRFRTIKKIRSSNPRPQVLKVLGTDPELKSIADMIQDDVAEEEKEQTGFKGMLMP